MNKLLQLQGLLDRARTFDFLAPLALRLFLAPIFWMAGLSKYNSFENTAAWFGNPDWGLGLPFPDLLAFLATSTELAGGIMLLFGFGVRWVSIPLMFTMIIAVVSVHWGHGWQSIADAKFCMFNCSDAIAASEKLGVIKDLLKEYGNYDWLTEQGSVVILNNGIEYAVTYFIMLLTLFFIGSGKYASIDYWIAKKFNN